MRIGIDVDGVLADFVNPYIERVIAVTGEDRFPPRPFEVTEWLTAQAYGYTGWQADAAMVSIYVDPFFWQNLPPYPNTKDDLVAIGGFIEKGHEVYFITARAGVRVKRQTERWLAAHTHGEAELPVYTVLISEEKGACAAALDLDAYLDDRPDNLLAVHKQAPTTHTGMMTRPWNMKYQPLYVPRVTSVREFLDTLI